jgi:taurine dioxygenase
MQITAQTASCGATIRGIDLAKDLSDQNLSAIRKAWLDYQVLGFPEQSLSIPDLERFALAIGPSGDDPYIRSIPGHAHVVQVKREANEKTPIFAETWHTDWSFLKQPPAGTALYGNVIPPVGGDTLFSNQYAAWDALPADLRKVLADRHGIHSARNGYSRQGLYGEKDKGRSMAIIYDDHALKTQLHPIARVHPETGRTALFVSPGYTIGIEGLPEDESRDILLKLFAHQIAPEFIYRHHWSAGMLTLWDNRCLIHAATGGYEGHARLLHRITIGERLAQVDPVTTASSLQS